MYKLPIYRDGALPDLRQQIHRGEITILRCSYWVLQLWNHTNLASPYWRLYWNAEEGAEVQLGERRVVLSPERLVLITPAAPFTTRFSGTPEEAENVMLGCPAAQWSGEARVVHHFFTHFLAGAPYDRIAPQLFAIPLDANLRGLLQALTAVTGDDPPTLSPQQSFMLQALIYAALASVPDTLWPAPQTDPRVRMVMQLIETHYPERLTNTDFGQVAAMSSKSLVRLFKEKTGRTPLDALLQRRLEQASILLHHSDESIESIAARCGFFDRHHFSKLFQRAFSVGPAGFRKTRLP